MIRANDIQKALLHLIGWQQSYDTTNLKIADSLTESESGLYFQQVHPLLTLENMSCIAPDFKNIEFPEYEDKEYTKGNIVSYNDKLYKLIQDSNVGNGGTEPYIGHNLYDSNYNAIAIPENWEEEDIRPNKVNTDNATVLTDENTVTTTFITSRQSSADDPYRFGFMLTPEVEVLKNVRYRLNCEIGGVYDVPSVGSIDFVVEFGGKRSTPMTLPNSSSLAKFDYAIDCQLEDGTITRPIFWVTQPDDSGMYVASGRQVSFTVSNVIVTAERNDRGEDIPDINTGTAYIAPDNSEYWEETNPFSEWLENKTKASIQKAISRYAVEKNAGKTYTTLCENRTLFEGTGRLVDTVKNRQNLVGFEIVPVRAKGVTTKINRIGLQFTKPGTYKLYLMHSSRAEPIQTIELEKTNTSFEWFTLTDVYLPYQSENNDAGGSWYLVYRQSELPEGSQAIRKDRDWSKGPCKACTRREYLSWMAWSKYIEVHPFYISEELVEEGPTLWDVENNTYTYDNNYGINLDVTVACDITDFIVEQRMMFQDVIAKQLAVDMLKEFAYNANVRTKRHSINASRIDILYELDGDSSSMKQSGLSYQLDMAYKAIKLSTSGISRICLPCGNGGIKYRSI